MSYDDEPLICCKRKARAKNPVAYKVTSVSGLYKSRKTIDDRPLNEQELKTMKISGASEASWELSRKFEQVVQGVCQTRIAKHYGDDSARNFDFKSILGNFDLEELLAKTIKDSEKKEAIELLLLAEKEAKSKNKAKVSITSTWLDKHQIREKEIPSHSDATVQKRLIRRLKSMYTKKWNHSAAVAICLDPHLKLSFPYYGWRTILHLSSGSIREMLRIMSEIWDEVHLPIDGFIGLRGILIFNSCQKIVPPF